LSEWWDRQTGKDRRAFAILAVILGGFIALSIIAPGRQHKQQDETRSVAAAPPEPAAAIPDEIGNPISSTIPPAVERAARTFFNHYVAFDYGDGGVSAIKPASPDLLAQIRKAGSNPAMHRYKARVREIRGERDGDGYHVVAQIADTMNPATFPVGARFEAVKRGGGWRAVELTPDD
jgi:hypothetical protein